MKQYLLLIRLHHTVKNAFIFMPLFFAGKIFDQHLLIQSTLAFVCFSLVASAVYVFNDLIDLSHDQAHPEKSKRPLASGYIKSNQAIAVMLLLTLTALGGAAVIHLHLFYVLLSYLVLNVNYTLWLKHLAIVDILIVALGFVLRLVAGAVVVQVTLSKWIILMTFLLALFLALAKRRDDVLLQVEGIVARKNVSAYNLEFINACMMIMASVIIVCYILYTTSSEIEAKFASQNLYLTVVFVILGLFRYLQLSFVYNQSGNPTKIVIRDLFIKICILAWLASFLVMVYGH